MVQQLDPVVTYLNRHVLLEESTLDFSTVYVELSFTLHTHVSLVDGRCKHVPGPSLIIMEALTVKFLDNSFRIFTASSSCTYSAFEERYNELSIFMIATNVNNEFSMENVYETELIFFVNDIHDFDFGVVLVIHGKINAIGHVCDVEVLMEDFFLNK